MGYWIFKLLFTGVNFLNICVGTGRELEEQGIETKKGTVEIHVYLN